MEYTYVYIYIHILIITWWVMVKDGEGMANRSSSEVDALSAGPGRAPHKSDSAAEFLYQMFYLPSGKRLHNYGKIHHFQWENPLFLWPFSIVMLVYQRVSVLT